MIALIIEPVLAHYRKDFYEYTLKCKYIDFKLLGGKDYEGVKSIQNIQYKVLIYNSFSIFKHKLYYLCKSVKYVFSIKPEVIICSGVDFHLLHTLLIYFLYRVILRKEFYWWSQPTKGNQGKFGELIRQQFYKSSSGVFVYSQKGREYLLSLGVKSNNIQVINNSLNNTDYGYLNSDISNKTSKDKTFSLLFCGRIIKRRKLEILLQALAFIKQKYPIQLKCKIIGDGDCDSLKELTKDLNITDIVEFIGGKYGEELYPYFQSSDILIQPGGIGLSLLQALSFGLPVITSEDMNLHGSEIELLLPGKNGDFFEDGSFEKLAEKIIYWKRKISESENEIRMDCINVIEDKGYLPEKMSSLVIDYLKDRYIK